MSFIATSGITPLPNDSRNNEQLVYNDGFFPDIDLSAMRDAMRIDGTVTDVRLRDATRAAMAHVNSEVRSIKVAAAVDQYATLASVPAEQIDRQSVLLAHYLRAVYCHAKADLIERYSDYDTAATSLDDKRLVGFLANGPEEQRRNAQWAIADLLGRCRVTVELI